MGFWGHVNTFKALSLRDYRFLWLGQLSTSMGQWMDQTARAWLIYQMTNSPIQLGLVSAIRGIPLLIFGVLAGVVADRYARKAQLIISQSVNAVLNIVLATLILTHQVQVWHIYVTGFLAGTVQAFQQPARQVLINDLAGEEHLLNAIALNSAALNLSRSVGPAICGLLIEFVGIDYSYFAQAGLFAMATLWTVQIRLPESTVSARYAAASKETSVWSSIKEGFDYILTHRLIMALMVLGLAPIVLGMPFVSLMPIFAVDVFHGGAPTQGVLLTMVGVGAVIGALGMASMGRRQGDGRLVLAGAGGFGLSLIFFSQSPVLVMAMAFAFFAGFSNSSYMSQDQTIIQTLVPRELRGRVLGIYLLNRGLIPVGSLLAGFLAYVLGGPWAVTVMGALCLSLAVGVAIATPSLRKLRKISDEY